jgi:hypothetical protein
MEAGIMYTCILTTLVDIVLFRLFDFLALKDIKII